MTLRNDFILSPQVTLGSDPKLPLLTYFTTANPPASIVHTLEYITYPIIANTNPVKVFLVKRPFFRHMTLNNDLI